VVSDHLLDELSRALARPKLSTRVTEDDAAAFVELLRRAATLVDDPPLQRRYSSDPDVDYLVALAHASHAMLVAGDSDLLDLAPELPILSPRQFLTCLTDDTS
jgi:putative PIN family toxin of toxin-antitoxin system